MQKYKVVFVLMNPLDSPCDPQMGPDPSCWTHLGVYCTVGTYLGSVDVPGLDLTSRLSLNVLVCRGHRHRRLNRHLSVTDFMTSDKYRY